MASDPNTNEIPDLTLPEKTVDVAGNPALSEQFRADPPLEEIRAADETIRESDPPSHGNYGRQVEKSRADSDRQKRRKERLYAELWFVGTGLMFIFMFDDHLIGGVPVPWVGWFLIGVAVLGLLGVNVFSGGPLDNRLDDDPPPADSNENK